MRVLPCGAAGSAKTRKRSRTPACAFSRCNPLDAAIVLRFPPSLALLVINLLRKWGTDVPIGAYFIASGGKSAAHDRRCHPSPPARTFAGSGAGRDRPYQAATNRGVVPLRIWLRSGRLAAGRRADLARAPQSSAWGIAARPRPAAARRCACPDPGAGPALLSEPHRRITTSDCARRGPSALRLSVHQAGRRARTRARAVSPAKSARSRLPPFWNPPRLRPEKTGLGGRRAR